MRKLHLSQVDNRELTVVSLGSKLTEFIERRILAISAVMFLALGAWYYLPDFMFSPPFGMHYIRQTDSLAFVEYFKLGKGNLFQPGTLDLNTGPNDGRTAGEFPIIYLLASIIDKAIGHPTNSLRLLHLIIVIFGHCVFVRGVSIHTRQPALSLGIGCCLWGSSVVAYYGCNFLPDPAAYGLSLTGWGLFLGTLAGGRPRLTLAIVLTLTLAGLIKATASMHLVIIGGIQVIQSIHRRESTSIVTNPMTALLFAGLCFIVTWHMWAIHYNTINEANYFLTSATPIWNMSLVQIRSTTDLILRHWWTDYLHPSVWHALAFLAFMVVIKADAINRRIVASLLLLSASSASYVLLFYEKFADHDYYALHVMPLAGILLVGGSQAIQSFKKPWINASLLLGLWALAIASISLGHHDLQRRSGYNADLYSRTGAMLLNYNSSASTLPSKARVVVLGDNTPNGALSIIGRQGWSFPGYPIATVPDWRKLIRNGATHVLVIAPEFKPDVPLKRVEENDEYSMWEIIR